MTYNLPKPHFSYSQFSLWTRDKDAYRARYYESGPAFENAETVFGKKIAKMLEDGHDDPILKRVPAYVHKEYRIKLDLGGVPFLAVLDSFSTRVKRILEYKTGKIPWDAVRVSKHDQLVVYSLLVKEKFGWVDPVCRLVWIPTQYNTVIEKVGSRMMEGEGREIELIDVKPLVFKRRIAEWERKRMKEMIIKTAREISEDYTSWQKKTLQQ